MYKPLLVVLIEPKISVSEANEVCMEIGENPLEQGGVGGLQLRHVGIVERGGCEGEDPFHPRKFFTCSDFS